MKYPLSENQIFNYRPKPFFFITTSDDADLTPEKTEENLRNLKDCGFGGFVLFNKAYTEKNYLGEGWFSMVRNFAAAAKKLGLIMWINDGFDFPPGNVAGKVEKIAPELKQQRVRMKDGQLKVEMVDWGFPAFEHPRSGELFVELVYEQYKKQVGEYFGDPTLRSDEIFGVTPQMKLNPPPSPAARQISSRSDFIHRRWISPAEGGFS